MHQRKPAALFMTGKLLSMALTRKSRWDFSWGSRKNEQHAKFMHILHLHTHTYKYTHSFDFCPADTFSPSASVRADSHQRFAPPTGNDQPDQNTFNSFPNKEYIQRPKTAARIHINI